MKKVLFILIGLSLILPILSLARVADDCIDYCSNLDEVGIEPPEDQICICNPLESEDFEVIIGRIIDFIFKIAIPIVPLMMIYAGFLFVTAGGSTQKIEQAKNIIIWTIVGLAIVLLARGFLAIIEQLLGVRGA